MLHFDSDYMEGAHPILLEQLTATNLEQTSGYGTDDYCANAKQKIREAIHCPHAEVHFLVGGTQTNATVIDALLRSYEGVMAAQTGHIAVHEAGAIEASGHKVLTLPHQNGKIRADDIEQYLSVFLHDENREHTVAPGMVYISHPTEYGTLYSLAELEALSATCRKHNLPLYLDGARLGYGLMGNPTDVTLQDVARLCDAFYIGGTKVGALFGEAVVFTRPMLVPHFFTLIKQHGALLAKGRLLGIQFQALFTDQLYFRISRHAIEMAERLKAGLKHLGYTFYLETPTNQQFLALTPEQLTVLSHVTTYGFWETLPDGRTVVRLATSWATRAEDIEALLHNLSSFKI
ncbi:MAG: beta-eliminating lyase-related protein [Bacteroidaceae bacterium]